mmetsp:Transcript_8523/g.12724  ORF Transcript_8523/g.12724 Transcript_8523/m.12724 type:complete len:90 (-) Transcript_8523:120-389(-)
MQFLSSCRKPIVVFRFQQRFGTSLRVLLLENLVNRGEKGEIVKVKRGHFRNLLYPRKIAVYATAENIAKYKYLIDERQRNIENNKKTIV